jgi:hypothetical protein
MLEGQRLSWRRFVALVGDSVVAMRIAAVAGRRIPRPPRDRVERDTAICARVDDLVHDGLRTKAAQRQTAREFNLSLRWVERITNGA